MTNAYECTSAPGIYFAGTIGQAVGGLRKYGIPANSGAVHGHRYNARLLVDDLAARHFGMAAAAAGRAAGRRRGPVCSAAVVHGTGALAPEVVPGAGPVVADPDGLVRDEGIVSLAEFVDAAGPDGVAVTVETDDRGDIHPAVYVRRRGRVDADARLASDPLLDFSGAEQRAQLASLIDGVLG